jgi:hypothetical protein
MGKGIMFRDHQELGKRDNAQWPPTDWTKLSCLVITKIWVRGIMLRGLQQMGKGIMFRDHHELGKGDNAQRPPTDWARRSCSGITKSWGIMLKGLQQIGQRDRVQESPRVG